MKIHFLGIGGSGASAVAAIARANDFEVTGCDLNPYNEFTRDFPTNMLQTGHSASHLTDGVDFLIVTPAIFSLDPENEELLEAQKRNIPVLTWQEFMGQYLEKDHFVIAVSGTHGKSTTTAMIALMLEDAGLDPTVELGAIVPKWGKNYRVGEDKIFVTEADEFNDNFLATIPDIAVVTNIEMDHPEYFKDFTAVKDSFQKFLLKTKNTIVANISDSGVSEVLKVLMKETGVKCLDYSKNKLSLDLLVPGEFNVLNAKAAFAVGLLLGLTPAQIIKSLNNYAGIGRRFELVGKIKGADTYSDFGHHPTEIKTTLKAATEKFPNTKIWLIYEPHMFSRTLNLFDDFVEVFQNLPAYQILITDIYPSREIDTGKVNSQKLVTAINRSNVDFVLKEDIEKILKSEVRPEDKIFFMGAGDIDKLARELSSRV